MANVKVSDLTEDTSPTSDDFVLAVDNATSSSKKVSMANVVTAGLLVTAVTPGSYTNTNLTVDSKGRITAASSGTTSATLSVVTKNANYTLTSTDDVVEFTASGKVATLPDATMASKKVYIIQNASVGNMSFATTSAQTVNGSTTGTIIPNQALGVVPDGNNWIIV